MIKTLLILCHFATVFDCTVNDRGQDMVTPEPITEDQCCICNMAGKHSPEIFCIRLCPVNRSYIGIPITLDTGTDADIFTGNAAFFSFRAKFEGLSGDIII